MTATLYADLSRTRQSSVITVARRLMTAARARGIEVNERAMHERWGRVRRCPVGWFHGYPHDAVGIPWGLHHHRIAGVQLDALPAPEAWRARLAPLSAVYAPSQWCLGALRPLLPAGCEAFVVPHGLDAPVPGPAVDRSGEPFTALCFSIRDRDFPLADAHHRRKGVDLAVKAARIAGVRLVVRGGVALRRWLDAQPAATVAHVSLLDKFLSPGELSELYRAVHCVVCPSRAEAFGMVGMEALAHGTPVVAVAGTGMDEYLPEAGARVLVAPGGPYAEPLPTYGIEAGGHVMDVRADGVAEALRAMRATWRERAYIAEQGAASWLARWSWEAVARPLVDWIASRV